MERHGRDTLIEEVMRSAMDLAWAVRHTAETRGRGARQLTFSRLMILRLLAKTGRRNISDVAVFLGVSDPDASNIVDKLVNRRLLQRVENPADRRIRELFLTPAARRLLSEYERARKSLLTEAFRKCSSEDLYRASEALDRVSWCVAQRRQAASGKKPERGSLRQVNPDGGRGGL